MPSIYSKLANGKLVLLFFAITAIFSLYLFPASNAGYRLPDDPDVVALELTFSKVRFTSIVHTWVEHKGLAAIGAFRRMLVVLDTIFPVVYALFFASLNAWLVKVAGEKPGRFQSLMLGMPFVAGLFDWIENSFLFLLFGQVRSVADIDTLPAGQIFAASAFASLKFVLLIISLLVSVFYALRQLARLISR